MRTMTTEKNIKLEHRQKKYLDNKKSRQRKTDVHLCITGRVERFNTFRDFQNKTHCFRSGLFLEVKF